jgi:hypothetical protein
MAGRTFDLDNLAHYTAHTSNPPIPSPCPNPSKPSEIRSERLSVTDAQVFNLAYHLLGAIFSETNPDSRLLNIRNTFAPSAVVYGPRGKIFIGAEGLSRRIQEILDERPGWSYSVDRTRRVKVNAAMVMVPWVLAPRADRRGDQKLESWGKEAGGGHGNPEGHDADTDRDEHHFGTPQMEADGSSRGVDVLLLDAHGSIEKMWVFIEGVNDVDRFSCTISPRLR